MTDMTPGFAGVPYSEQNFAGLPYGAQDFAGDPAAVVAPGQRAAWEAWYAADHSGRTMAQDFHESKYDAMRRAFLAGAAQQAVTPEPARETTPGQAALSPAFARWYRISLPLAADDVLAAAWTYQHEAERRFWAEVDAMLATGDRIVRDVLESLCRRDGLPLESSVAPGEPARNYDLALRLGIGHVFGLKPQPAAAGRPDLDGGLLRNIDQLHDLVRDMFEAFPDTADEQEWRDRAGALHVCDPDGQPYRALTEEDM